MTVIEIIQGIKDKQIIIEILSRSNSDGDFWTSIFMKYESLAWTGLYQITQGIIK